MLDDEGDYASTFVYTDDEWARVASELRETEPWVRNFLEFKGREYLRRMKAGEGKPGRSFKRSREAWEGVANTARLLQGDLHTIGEHPSEFIYAFRRKDQDELKAFLASLPWFIDRADRMAATVEDWERTLPKRSNRSDRARDDYIGDLLFEWEKQGGQLRTAVRAMDGAAYGPLVSFLYAASTPVFKACGKPPMTLEALRSVVRKRARRHGG